MTPLPIDSHIPRVVGRLRESRALVLVAQPGAGKTTRVPPAILRSNLLSNDHPNLVILQPRRVAARASAERIADENAWTLGQEVGYHIRFEKRLSPRTRLRVLTEGILTRQLLDDPYLEGIGAVILDEFHERSIHVDLALAMLRELQQTVRNDLLLIVMSATLDAQTAAKFLGNCPIIQVPGKLFPVDIQYRPVTSPLIPATASAVEEVLARPDSTGDILVFLPGADEIRRVARELAPIAERTNAIILPLHGSLPFEQQTAALRPSPRRKIILSTNIAETSLTIDGVTWVIDAGLARVPQFDPQRGLDRLELSRISKASATQRAGRAGRTAPGQCIRLFSAKDFAALDDFELPEIRRVDLCSAVLDVFAWGKSKIADFAWFEPPPHESLDSAHRLLELLGALNMNGLTPLGRRLMKLPLHPRLGRLLCAAEDAGCLDEGATLAALLSEKDIRRPDTTQPRHLRGPATQGDSDLLLRMDDLHHAAHDPQIDPFAVRQVARVKEQLERIASTSERPRRRRGSSESEDLLKLLLLAYPDRVCRRRANDPSAAIMTGGVGVRLDPESVVRKSEFFLALDARQDLRSLNKEAQVRIASAIDPAWLHEFPQSIKRERQTVFDESKQRVVTRRSVRYLDLILSEDADAQVDPQEAAPVLFAALRPRAAEIFAADQSAANVLARVALLRRHMPEHQWPTFDGDQLGEILGELCQGRKSVEEVTRQPLAAALESHLQYPLDQLLRQHAPEFIEVPTGNRIRLEYRADQPPILAVRLQEIFSWPDTPRIAGGRVPVLLHLLGPNYRPVQITSDLKSFWATTYFQVRKDLRVRYPKHSWPDDPLTAPPVAKGGRKRNG